MEFFLLKEYMLKHISVLIDSGKLQNCPKILLVGGSSGDKESAYNEGDPGLIPGSGRCPGEGNSYPLQYFAWRIPWTDELGGLQSMGPHRVGKD